MTPSLRFRLSVMTFLQFVIWGAWYGQLSKYLLAIGFNGAQVGNIYAAFSIAMIASPFFVGMIADRFFNAERVLGGLHLLGAALLYALAQITTYDAFFWTMLLYCMTFTPTLALANSISMRQMRDPATEFPPIRVLGTIAWIAVTNLIGFMGWGDKTAIFYASMFTSLAIAAFSFALPKTPPLVKGPVTAGQVVGKDAFSLLKDKPYRIFFIASVLVCIPLSFYYAFANPSITDAYKAAFLSVNPGANLPDTFYIENKMSLGQASEVLFMLLLPFAYRKMGIKNILLLALAAWIVRFLLLGYGDAGGREWMLYAAILLHGVCFDFFFVSGMIYTDQKAGEQFKSSAQGLISLATYGIGMLFGSLLSGRVQQYYTAAAGDTTSTVWTAVWLVPAAIAGIVALLFVFFFRQEKQQGG
jgi:nucleoside transporter